MQLEHLRSLVVVAANVMYESANDTIAVLLATTAGWLEDGEPMKVAVPICDLMAGMYASVGILAAVRHFDGDVFVGECEPNQFLADDAVVCKQKGSVHEISPSRRRRPIGWG